MKYAQRVLALLAAALLVSGCSSTRPPAAVANAPLFTLEELLSRMPVKDSVEARWAYTSLLGLGDQDIVRLCSMLDAPKQTDRVQAEYALQGLAMFVTRYGAEAERLKFVGALGKALERQHPVEAASFLIERLQVAGRKESVPVLSRFLSDEKLCEVATRALVAMRADATLLEALPRASHSARVNAINALGELRSRAAVGALLGESASDDPAIRSAARAALASTGDLRADSALTKAMEGGTEPEREEGVANRIVFARRLAEGGDRSKASTICRELIERYPQRPHVRAAALAVLAQTLGPGAMEDLVAATRQPDKPLRVAALRVAGRVPGGETTERWIAELKTSPPEVRAEILGMLGERGDSGAYDAALAALGDRDSAVRAAGVETAIRLKGVEAIPALLAFLEKTRDAGDIAAVRGALGQMPANQLIPAAVRSLQRLTPPACAAVTELLSGYGSLVPSDPILALSGSDSTFVRLAAVKALSSIATEADRKRLTGVLLGATSDAERSAAQSSLAAVCSRIPDPNERAAGVLEALPGATPSQRVILLRALGRIGGAKALSAVLAETKSPDADLRDAAVRALAEWPTIDAYDGLLATALSKEKLNLRVLALRGCVRVVENSSLNAATASRYHEKTLAAAERPEEKRLVLGALANLRSRDALRLVVPYLRDDSLAVDAGMAAGKIAWAREENKEGIASSDVARVFIEANVSPKVRPAVVRAFDAKTIANDPPEGFTALFDGKDLSGWKGLVGDPLSRARMDGPDMALAQARADSVMRAHWTVAGGILLFDGKGENLCTVKDYGDFELLVDWRIEKEGDSGIYLRGSPQVQIWDPGKWPEGSGGLYNNQRGSSKPKMRADNPVGEWNTFRIRMIGEYVTVYLNGVLVVDSVALENYWDRAKPIFPTGQLELQSHSTPLCFRNIFIREIARKHVPYAGNLLNGSDLTGWKIIDGKEGSWQVTDRILSTQGEGGGWLSTIGEFGDFQLDLEYRISEGGNSGVFIRSPQQGDPAYTGLEIQVLDDYAARYAELKPWQFTGSIYGVQAPAMRASKKANEWQRMQITADGPHVVVLLNGQKIVDTDLISHMDKEASHPGLKRRAGHIGLQNHGSRVEYRTITIRELR